MTDPHWIVAYKCDSGSERTIGHHVDHLNEAYKTFIQVASRREVIECRLWFENETCLMLYKREGIDNS